jgi:hypothetical protein
VVHPVSTSSLAVDHNQALPGQPPRATRQNYAYDRVFSAEDDQATVYGSVTDLIDKFLAGYNVTIFAYGQTSSGKSFRYLEPNCDISKSDFKSTAWGKPSVKASLWVLEGTAYTEPTAWT